jgi:hypothetical protein
MAIDYDQYSKSASASGALEGAGSGAMLGSYFAPGIGTAVGAGLGGIVGAVRGAKESKANRTEYDIAEEKRLLELKRRMEENTLGLSDDEKAYLMASGRDAITAEQDVAKQMRESQLASAYQGAGTAFGKQVEAEEQRMNAVGKLGIDVAEADLNRKMKEESEYWARLANVSKREADQQEASAAASQGFRDDFNDFLTSESTERQQGEMASEIEAKKQGKALEEKFGLKEGEASLFAKNVMGNGSLRELFFSTLGSLGGK